MHQQIFPASIPGSTKHFRRNTTKNKSTAAIANTAADGKSFSNPFSMTADDKIIINSGRPYIKALVGSFSEATKLVTLDLNKSTATN